MIKIEFKHPKYGAERRRCLYVDGVFQCYVTTKRAREIERQIYNKLFKEKRKIKESK